MNYFFFAPVIFLPDNFVPVDFLPPLCFFVDVGDEAATVDFFECFVELITYVGLFEYFFFNL